MKDLQYNMNIGGLPQHKWMVGYHTQLSNKETTSNNGWNVKTFSALKECARANTKVAAIGIPLSK